MYLDANTRLALGRDRMDAQRQRAKRERMLRMLTADRDDEARPRRTLRRALRRADELAEARAR